MADSSRTPLKAAEDWGSISEIVNAPLENVAPDSWWISVVLLYLTLPFWIFVTIPAICCGCLFVNYLIGCCNSDCIVTFSVLGSVRLGRPFWLAPNVWRGWLSILWGFLLNGGSRLRLFNWEWEKFGRGQWWWHGEGVWCWTYADVSKIMKGVQLRQPAFGCVRAPVPDLFASNILIFLPNTPGDSEWKAVRQAMHSVLFVDAEKRMKQLAPKLQEMWKNPTLTDLNNETFLQEMVAKSVMWLFFNVWLEDADAAIIAGWNTAAKFCIFPRLIQRVAFNLFINRMKTLREQTIGLVEKLNLQAKFNEINEKLGKKYHRSPVVKLADEVMYILCFAGINGTTAAATTTVAFLQNQKPSTSDAANIDLSKYPTQADMEAVYKTSPIKYIKEACRIDPPVTSATSSTAQDEVLTLAGQERMIDKLTLNQYVLSRANRDESEFSTPGVFNPDRPDLNKALTWNGAFGDPRKSREQEEQEYPRICPGRYLSLDIVAALVNHAIGNTGP